MNWRVIRKDSTISTNADAAALGPGDVVVARSQSAGRGRLDHSWHSAPGMNLTMSAVVSVAGMPHAGAATLPLAAGLAAARAVRRLSGADAGIKWPNDVLAAGRKICGILCERSGDNVVAGIGLNVLEREFPTELADRATSLALLGSNASVEDALDAVLEELSAALDAWRKNGFAGIWSDVARLDLLKSRIVTVFQTDGDANPRTGLCGGIASDGSLLVGGESVWAGEAHLKSAPDFPYNTP